MTREQMNRSLDEIAAHLSVIYRAEKHWSKEWEKGDTGMKRFPPASPAGIDRLEEKLGESLPPSYREFLTVTDGCEHFWLDFSFLGTTGEGSSRVLAKTAEYIEWQKEKFSRTVGQPVTAIVDAWERANGRNLYLERHLPIATNFGGELYVFDTRTRKRNGEMEIVFWDISFGAWEEQRYSDFGGLLEFTLSEVTERAHKCQGKSAKTPKKEAVAKSAPKKVSSKKPAAKGMKKAR